MELSKAIQTSSALPSRGGVARFILVVTLLAWGAVGPAQAKSRLAPSKARKPAIATPKIGLRWVSLPAGSFVMGSKSGDADAKPARRVTLKAFAVLKTEVTVGQYRACVKAARCSKPGTSSDSKSYNWGSARGDKQPINAVSWLQAKAFCNWLGARLPSEAEWEYAARSAGKKQRYAWGNAKADCSRAVIREGGKDGCGRQSTWPVCSKPAGNTAQGLCDMAGNVWEWVADCYQDSYVGAPVNNAARRRCSGRQASQRAVRGGSWNFGASSLRASGRGRGVPTTHLSDLGFRCAKTL